MSKLNQTHDYIITIYVFLLNMLPIFFLQTNCCTVFRFLAVFGRFWAFLGIFGHFWAFLGIFGPFLGVFGHFWAFLGVFGRFLAFFGHFWPFFGKKAKKSFFDPFFDPNGGV